MITYLIIAITGITSFIAFGNRLAMGKFLFIPTIIHRENQYYRFISSGFIHANWPHLLINMLVLYFFGRHVEATYADIFGKWGGVLYLGMYVGGLIVSSIPTYLKHIDNDLYASLGASGAVSAILFSWILFYPTENLYLFGLIPLPGIIYGVGYLIYSVRMAKQSGDNINHEAHFYGAVFGLLYTIIAVPKIVPYFLHQITNW